MVTSKKQEPGVRRKPESSVRPPNGVDRTGEDFKILEEFSCPIWRSGEDRKCYYFNHAWLDFTGRTLSQELNDGWVDGVHPEDVDRFFKIYEEAFDNRRPFEMEYRLRNHDGEYRWINSIARPFYDRNGNFSGYLGACFDITARRRAEESLRLFRSLIDQSSDAIEVIDPETLRFLDCNQSAHQDLGYTREEFLRLTIPDIDPIFDEAMASSIQKDLNRFGFSLFESIHRRKDGSTFPVEIKTKRVRLEQDYRLAIVRDITQRKQAEDALRQSEQQLVDAQRLANIGSWSWDIQNNKVTWSNELCRIYGVEPNRGPRTYEAFLECVHPDHRDEVAAEVDSCLRTRQPFLKHRRLVRPDGETRIVLVRATVICDEQDHPIRLIGVSQDITERLEAEEALRAAQRKYRDIFENAREGIFQTTPQGTFLTANPALSRMFGFDSPEELIATRTDIGREHYVDPQRREEFKKLLNSQGFVTNFELEVLKKDGNKIWISENVRAVRDQNGAVIYFEGTTQDITERKLAEEARTHSENQMAEAQSLAHVGSWNWEIESNDLSWSDELYEIFGEDRTFVPTYQEYLARIHPDEREATALAIKDCLQDGQPFSQRGRIIRSDGEIRTIDSHISVVCDGTGQPLRMFGACQDVTSSVQAEQARIEAERKYREIFENAGEGIFQSTPEGRFIAANPALAVMFGFETPEELIRDCSDISSQIYADASRREEFMRVLAQNVLVTGFEIQALRKDRSRFWVLVNARAVRDRGGKILYYEGIALDITERKKAEQTSAAFATLARRLSGASTNFEAARIIAATARQLFGWDACNLDLYDSELDLVHPLLNVDTIKGKDVDVTPLIADSHPTARGRRVLKDGPELILREHPIKFDSDSVPFGDTKRPAASIMSMPIKHGTEIVGLLSIQSYTYHAYDRDSLEGVVALAEHCGEAMNRIRAEELFRESEERYRDLVENSHEFICTHDLNGVVLSANRAAAVALGVDLDQLVGKGNIRDFLVPSNRDRFDEYIDRVKTDLATSGLMVVRTSSGEERVWEYYNSIRTEGVAEPIVRGIARDITEQRQAAKALLESEERYRELFENSRDAIYVHDLNGRYISVNRSAEELSGFTREEILGNHYASFIASQHLKEVRENFCLKLDALVETTYEAAIICKDGSRKPVEVSSRVIYKDEVAVGIQGTARDISERKKAQEALQVYSRRLIEAQEAERQNIARELHDQIGQILTAVRLSLQRIEKTCQTGCCFPHIVEGIEVVDEALSRVRELSLELRPSLLDDLGLAAALRWYVARYTERTGIKTKIAGDTKVRRISHEVETACFRIIQEALNNTARHSRATKASIKVETVNGKLLFTISDNGIGFRSDLLLNGMASSALGLRGMQERALAVRGWVKIHSTPNNGTQVIVSVPAK